MGSSQSQPSGAPKSAATEVIDTGRTVYGHDGRRGEFIGRVREAFLVRPIARFTSYDGEEYEDITDALELWDRAYLAAPVAAVDAEVLAARAEIEAAHRKLLDTQREIAEAQREHLEMLKRLKRYEPLRNLEPLLNGEITHVVEDNGYSLLRISTFAEALVYRDDYDRKDVMRMLSLKPTPDGAIQWHLSRYSDGSGANNSVVLCTSMDEAREAALAQILDSLDRHSFETHPHLWAAAVKNADELGLTLSPAVVAKGVAYRVSIAEVAVEKAAEALRGAEAARNLAAGQEVTATGDGGSRAATKAGSGIDQNPTPTLSEGTR